MIIVTDPRGPGLDSTQAYWLYGANDTLGTRMVHDVLFPQLAGQDLVLYRAALGFQSACLAMTLRGIRIDENERREALRRCQVGEAEAVAVLNQHPTIQESWDVKGKRPAGSVCPVREASAKCVWGPRGAEPDAQLCKHCGAPRLVGQQFNPHSSSQCARLFYDTLGCKKRYAKKHKPDGSRSVTTDDEALEATANKYVEHASLVDAILAARMYRKQRTVLGARLDADGRWRGTFNVCAAKTGRMSSSQSPYYSGGNVQNVADKDRGIFVADPGLELFYADLEAAESTLVAWDAGCTQDIKDHADGDAHTSLAKTLFPDLPWGTGPDKEIASSATPFGSNSQNSTWRQIAKVTRHGTNIGMSAAGVARQLHQPRDVGRDMRDRYFLRYPENLARQLEIRRQVRDSGVLVGPVGNTRRFLGRLWEDDVQREALAQTQQSTVAWMINLALWRIWHELDTRLNIAASPRPSDPNRVWLLAQVHDAILGQYRPGDLDTLRRVRDIMSCPIEIRGHRLALRVEIQVGPAWAHGALRTVEL